MLLLGEESRGKAEKRKKCTVEKIQLLRKKNCPGERLLAGPERRARREKIFLKQQEGERNKSCCPSHGRFVQKTSRGGGPQRKKVEEQTGRGESHGPSTLSIKAWIALRTA